jgi:transcription factor AP-2
LTSHGGIGLTGGSPAYTTHTGSHSGRAGPTSSHSQHGGHGPSSSMHHQSLQSDFQPPYFPPPFHHSAQSPPQQQVNVKDEWAGACHKVPVISSPFQNHGLEYLGSDPYGQPLSSLHHAPLHHYNQLAGLRPSQEQLGIHRSHRDSDLQQHVVSFFSDWSNFRAVFHHLVKFKGSFPSFGPLLEQFSLIWSNFRAFFHHLV